jgi:hypothetical protein
MHPKLKAVSRTQGFLSKSGVLKEFSPITVGKDIKNNAQHED